LSVRDATLEDLEVVASWLHSEDECLRWAGPAVSYPLTPGALARQIGFAEADDVVLADEAGPVGFGQLVPRRDGQVHLARVIVRPDARGAGLGRALVETLLERAAAAGAREASLNVYLDNEPARRLYGAVGFVPATAPDGLVVPQGSQFMACALGGAGTGGGAS
jgi:ribosomal protein S18 acetylase RimI-like enzyme